MSSSLQDDTVIGEEIPVEQYLEAYALILTVNQWLHDYFQPAVFRTVISITMYFAMYLQIIFFILCFQGVYCNSAPDKDLSLDFPADWCDKKTGTATRTTGECICKGQCDGPECVNQQGLSFYSYAKCPTCKCMPVEGGKHAGRTAEKKIVEEEEHEEEQIPIRKERGKSGRAHYYSSEGNQEDDDDQLWGITEWIDEYGRALFAIGATVAILSLIYTIHFL